MALRRGYTRLPQLGRIREKPSPTFLLFLSCLFFYCLLPNAKQSPNTKTDVSISGGGGFGGAFSIRGTGLHIIYTYTFTYVYTCAYTQKNVCIYIYIWARCASKYEVGEPPKCVISFLASPHKQAKIGTVKTTHTHTPTYKCYVCGFTSTFSPRLKERQKENVHYCRSAQILTCTHICKGMLDDTVPTDKAIPPQKRALYPNDFEDKQRGFLPGEPLTLKQGPLQPCNTKLRSESVAPDEF